MKKIFATALMMLSLSFLPGCLDARPEQHSDAPLITNVPTKDDLTAAADGIKKDTSTKQEAIQSNIQALLGVGIGKLSDELVHFSADIKDLFHVQMGDFKNQMSASLASNNELRVMLKNQMTLNAKLQANLTASLAANAQLSATLDNKMQGIAGIAGKIDQTTNDMKQNLQAGHDVNNITQSFTKEVLASIVSANHTNAWNTTVANLVVLGVIVVLVAGAAFVVCMLFRSAKNSAEASVRDMKMQLHSKQEMLERALTHLPPDVAEKVFPKPGDLISKVIVK